MEVSDQIHAPFALSPGEETPVPIGSHTFFTFSPFWKINSVCRYPSEYSGLATF